MNARDAEEAENNLLNFFDKLTGNETLQHFEKMGVSIEKIMAKSKKDGTDFVDTMLDEIGRLTKDGTDAIAMTKLFPDRQARQAAMILVQQRKELEKIRSSMSGNTSGILEGDFGRIGATSKFGLQRAAAGLERIGIALGKAFGPALGDMAERFATLAEKFAAWAEKNPGFVRAIGYTIASIVGLRTAFAALGFIFGGKLGLILQFSAGGFARHRHGAYPTRADAAQRLATIAPWVIRGIALLFNPIGWLVIIAGAAIGLVSDTSERGKSCTGQIVRPCRRIANRDVASRFPDRLACNRMGGGKRTDLWLASRFGRWAPVLGGCAFAGTDTARARRAREGRPALSGW